jgi:hypothetical protein
MKKKTIASRFLTCTLITLAVCCFQTAKGGSSDTASFTPKLYVNAGVYFPESATTFQVNGSNGLGTLIFVEQFLHVDRSPLVFTANAFYKITRRSVLSARYFYYNVKGNFELAENDIKIRDTVISIGANLKTDWTNNYFGLNYNYAIFSKPQWSSGLSLGLRTSMIKIKLDYAVQNKTGEYSSSIAIPIILWGLFAEGYMAPRLRGSYSFEMFRLSLNGISGLVYENRFGLEYYFLKHLGIGLSYNQILYRIKEVPFDDRFDGNISYTLSGMQLNLHARF